MIWEGTVILQNPHQPMGSLRVPHIRPQYYHLPWTDPQTQLPASSPYPSDLPSQTASISDQQFCHNALDRQTNRWLEGCLMTIGRFCSIQSCVA